MKRFSLSALLILACLFVAWPVSASAQANIDVVIFYGNTCPHCHQALSYLEQLKNDYPQLLVHDYEVYVERDNIPLFMDYATAYGVTPGAVPSIFIGEQAIIGNDQEQILVAIQDCANNDCRSALSMVGNGVTPDSIPEPAPEPLPEPPPETILPPNLPEEQVLAPEPEVFDETLAKPLAVPPGADEAVTPRTPGEQAASDPLQQLTLLAVISGAAVDAINPCAFAVLIILITTILGSGNRRRAALAGLAFAASIYISYFLMGLGLYSAIAAAGLSRIFYIIVSILAILIGLFNLKDWLWYGKWFVMEVPMSWRPRLQKLIRGVSSVPGAFVIGFAVSLFLLPCTSGPYVVILGLLAKATTRTTAVGYLALYNLVFILPMLIIIAAITLGATSAEKAEAWRQSKLRVLHLIAGLIILGLGILMLTSVALGYV